MDLSGPHFTSICLPLASRYLAYQTLPRRRMLDMGPSFLSKVRIKGAGPLRAVQFPDYLIVPFPGLFCTAMRVREKRVKREKGSCLRRVQMEERVREKRVKREKGSCRDAFHAFHA